MSDLADKAVSPENLPEEVWQRLEKTILKLFSSGDFHRISMRMVAKDAAISSKTIYKYYRSKEQMLLNFNTRWRNQIFEDLEHHLKVIENTRDRLRKYLWHQFWFLNDHPEIAQIIYVTIPTKSFMNKRNYNQDALRLVLYQILRDGDQKNDLCSDIKIRTIFDLIMGTIIHKTRVWIYDKRSYPLTDGFEEMFTYLWRAIGKIDA